MWVRAPQVTSSTLIIIYLSFKHFSRWSEVNKIWQLIQSKWSSALLNWTGVQKSLLLQYYNKFALGLHSDTVVSTVLFHREASGFNLQINRGSSLWSLHAQPWFWLSSTMMYLLFSQLGIDSLLHQTECARPGTLAWIWWVILLLCALAQLWKRCFWEVTLEAGISYSLLNQPLWVSFEAAFPQ